MEAEQNIVGLYVRLKPKQRIKFLMKHYKDFEAYRDSYRECVISIMIAINEYSRNKQEDLGVRVQMSGDNSDTTYKKAIERMEVEDCFDDVSVINDMFPDEYENALISTALFEWTLMKKEFDQLNSCMKLVLNDYEFNLMRSFLARDKGLMDIADDYAIEIESARKKVYRIKSKVLKGVIPWFKEYEINIPA